MNWKNQNVLITGAGRGLGRALALAFSKAGATVVAVARTESDLVSLASEVRGAGGKIHTIVADVGNIHAVHPVVGEATQVFGPITVLVNNASTLGPVPLRPWLETECEDLMDVLALNLVTPFRFTKAVLGSMLLRSEGLVINLSSDAAVNAYPEWGSYSVAKAGLDHLTRIWAAETASSGVRLINVDPGEMATGMHAAALPDADPSTLSQPSAVAMKLLERLADASVLSGGRISL